jgi:hypothetical protein
MLTKSIFLVSASQEIKHFIYNTEKKCQSLHRTTCGSSTLR